MVTVKSIKEAWHVLWNHHDVFSISFKIRVANDEIERSYYNWMNSDFKKLDRFTYSVMVEYAFSKGFPYKESEHKGIEIRKDGSRYSIVFGNKGFIFDSYKVESNGYVTFYSKFFEPTTLNELAANAVTDFFNNKTTD